MLTGFQVGNGQQNPFFSPPPALYIYPNISKLDVKEKVADIRHQWDVEKPLVFGLVLSFSLCSGSAINILWILLNSGILTGFSIFS